MRKLLSLMAGVILAASLFSSSAQAQRIYGGVSFGVPAAAVYVGPGYGYRYNRAYYLPYYNRYYYNRPTYYRSYYGPYRHNYRPYRHYYRPNYYRGYRRW